MPAGAAGQLFWQSISAVHLATHCLAEASGAASALGVGLVVGGLLGGGVSSVGSGSACGCGTAVSLEAQAATMKTARSEEPTVRSVALRTVPVFMHCEPPSGKLQDRSSRYAVSERLQRAKSFE